MSFTLSLRFLLLFLQVSKMPASGTATASHPVTDAGERGGEIYYNNHHLSTTSKDSLKSTAEDNKSEMEYNKHTV